MSHRTIQNKHGRLFHLSSFDELYIKAFNPKMVEDELNRLEKEKGYSRVLTSHVQKELKAAMSFAVHAGILQINPLEKLKKRKTPKKKKTCLNVVEANKLLLEAKRRKHDFYEIWLLSLTLALRASELRGLKWTDVDLEHGLIHLQRQWLPNEGIVETLKDKEPRPVPIPHKIYPPLKQMQLKSKSDFVIETDSYSWKNGNQASVLKEFCNEIGIKEVTHHQLRASYITLALEDNVPLGIVKESVGHSKLATTDEYFRAAGLHLKGQMDKLSIKIPIDSEAEVIKLGLA